MRKLMLLAAMLALALVAAAPAVAQISQEAEQEDVESGGVEPVTEIANKGNNVNLCAAVLQQQAQSGNVQNVQGTSQYEVVVDDIEFEGSTITITPELVSECTQTIQQAAAAAAKGEAKAEKAKAEAKAGKAEAKAGKAEAKALPKTGGVAGVTSLLGLGAGALLVAGGLIARRITR